MADKLSKHVALRIINSLKDGVPSTDDVDLFSSTKNKLDKKVFSDLDEVRHGNYGKVKFLNGSYGEGKTHFLSRVRKKALNDNYLVSMFAISPRGISLDMMERAFGELIKTLMVNEYKEGLNEQIIEFILSRWARNIDSMEREIRSIRLDKDLKNALIEIGKRIDQKELYYSDMDILNGWFQAETHPIGELRKKYYINNHINPRNVFDILKSFAFFAKKIGYSGWVVLIDEQEVISTLLTTRRRELTDQNIRILIDDQANMDGIYILFATTDEFFTDPVRGVVSYPALKTRITDSNTFNLSPIEISEMKEVAYKLKEICQIAWGVKLRISNNDLDQCVAIAEEYRIPSAKARTFVKSIIRLMDEIYSGKTENPIFRFKEIYGKTFDEVATERENAEAE